MNLSAFKIRRYYQKLYCENLLFSKLTPPNILESMNQIMLVRQTALRIEDNKSLWKIDPDKSF